MSFLFYISIKINAFIIFWRINFNFLRVKIAQKIMSSENNNAYLSY